MHLTKGHGTGNDFLILSDPSNEHALSARLVRRLCDRRTGVGADGVLRVVPAEYQMTDVGAEWFMDHWNSDGTVGIMCGNGARVFARYLVDRGLAEAGRLQIATRGGVRRVEVPQTGDVRVDMGPALMRGACWVRMLDQTYPAFAVAMPNPHAVVLLEPGSVLPDRLPVPQVDPQMFPDGANVEFVEYRGDGTARLRVYERGSGETMSCGTGACASAAVLVDHLSAPQTIRIDVDGGSLGIRVGPSVQMTGPAELVADLTISQRLWRDWSGPADLVGDDLGAHPDQRQTATRMSRSADEEQPGDRGTVRRP